jgi:O-antigen ligase
MIVILVVLIAASALITLRFLPAESARLSFSRRLPALAATAMALVVAGLVIGGVGEKGEREPERLRDPSGSRLTSVKSRRYDYWRVGLGAFGREPLLGVGAGGFRYEWLRERPVDEGVREAHSLELGMAADLGLPGLLGLAFMVGGVAVAGRRALASQRPLAAGCCAASMVWLLHASIDWDWEIPAVTLPVIIMAGGLIAASEEQDLSL